MINIAIAGIGGRMGQSLYACLQETHYAMRLSQATMLAGDARIGKAVGDVFGGDSTVVISEQLSDDFDVLIDFTSVSATLAHMQQCRAWDKAIVIGTTGFTPAQLTSIHAAAEQQTLFMSANMSIGVNLMQQLVATAAKALHQQADIEIVEAHHKHKVDAPSGTALMIGRAIAEGMGVDLQQRAVFAREGITGERQDGSIGFSTIRGGDVVGEHTAYYYMAGERLEISHRATDRKIFARGALFAADYVSRQGHGLYSMADALAMQE